MRVERVAGDLKNILPVHVQAGSPGHWSLRIGLRVHPKALCPGCPSCLVCPLCPGCPSCLVCPGCPSCLVCPLCLSCLPWSPSWS